MKVCSIFSQILKLFSRGGFEQAVKQHKAERHARGFTSWGQFMALLFCQLGRAHSLREICGGLACYRSGSTRTLLCFIVASLTVQPYCKVRAFLPSTDLFAEGRAGIPGPTNAKSSCSQNVAHD